MTRYSRVLRRLWPLFVAMGLQNFVLWYATEKLFMTSIGFDNASIALLAAVYSVAVLLFEVPSGFLADRWSRKGVLVIAGTALAIASLLGGLSHDVWQYIVASAMWGVYFALYSGTYDAIVYDTLLEENGTGDGFEKYAGRLHAVAGVFLTISSLAGGLIAFYSDLRLPYFVTIPIAVLSIFFLIILREPRLHKREEHVSFAQQAIATFKAISRKGIVLWLSLSTILMMLIDQLTFEFSQLWLIALAAPLIVYGPANALLLFSVTVAGIAADKVASRKKVMAVIFGSMLLATLTLALVHQVYLIIVALFVIATAVIGYQIIFNKLLHDQITSSLRAGALSATSSLSKILFVPTALMFGAISQSRSVFDASWILVGLTTLLGIVMFLTLAKIGRSVHSSASELDYDIPRK